MVSYSVSVFLLSTHIHNTYFVNTNSLSTHTHSLVHTKPLTLYTNSFCTHTHPLFTHVQLYTLTLYTRPLFFVLSKLTFIFLSE